MKTRSFVRVAARLGLAAAVLALAAGPALAQSAARVEGTVADTTGANVPGASVTATNLGTNALRETVTDTEGAFSITPLPAGPYQIKVSMPGFKEQTTKLTLNVNQVARLEFKLELGGVTETVEVTGVASLIDRSTSFIGTVVDS